MAVIPAVTLLGAALAASALPGAAPLLVEAPASARVPAGLVEVEGHPIAVAALSGRGRTEVLLARDRDVERFRLEGRRLVRIGRFRAPIASARPLRVDASSATGADALVTVVFGDDVRSVDQGTDTRLHAFVLEAEPSGALSPVSADLGAWLRLAGAEPYLQPRGPDAAALGPVRRVQLASGRYTPGDAVRWAGRSLLDATPLPGGTEALAWDGDRPVVLDLVSGERTPGGSILGDLGTVGEPGIAVRTERELLKGLDREGRVKDQWRAVPRRVLVAGGAAYVVSRGRSRPLFGKASGQDAVVRLEWSGGALHESRPYPGVDAFVLDFALLETARPTPAAVLLVNEKEDGSGRANLLFQEPTAEPADQTTVNGVR